MRSATRPMAALLALAASTAVFVAPSPQAGESPAWIEEHPSIGFGVQSVESQGAALSRYVEFAPYIENKWGVALDIYLAADYSGIIQALITEQIEFMHMGASGYAAAYLQSDGGVEPLVTAKGEDGSTTYHSVMFVQEGSGYETLADVEGKVFAWADPHSTSGFLMPNFQLREKGIIPDEYFDQTVFAGGHEQVVVGVKNGTYDVGVTWTDDPEKHHRGGVYMMKEQGVIEEDDIRIIWVSDPIPNPVIAAHKNVHDALVEDWKEMLLNLREENPELHEEVARGKSPGFVEVDHADYEPIVRMRKQMRDW